MYSKKRPGWINHPDNRPWNYTTSRYFRERHAANHGYELPPLPSSRERILERNKEIFAIEGRSDLIPEQTTPLDLTPDLPVEDYPDSLRLNRHLEDTLPDTTLPKLPDPAISPYSSAPKQDSGDLKTAAQVVASLASGGGITGKLIDSISGIFNSERKNTSDKAINESNRTYDREALEVAKDQFLKNLLQRQQEFGTSTEQFDRNLAQRQHEFGTAGTQFDRKYDLANRGFGLEEKQFQQQSRLQNAILQEQIKSSNKFGTPFGAAGGAPPLFGDYRSGGLIRGIR